MFKDAISDELRRLEYEVVQAERQLAAQEALVLELKRSRKDTGTSEEELEHMRDTQRQQERQRLLALLQG
jgi:hypothetical protein